jgi:two-component system, NtrC family, sensor kinase
VAFRWRIRQKLMLGLGLVVGVIVLLLAGTLYGLTAYRSTMKSFFSKLVDLKEAEELRASIKRIEASADSNRANELPHLFEAVTAARAKLQKYEDRLNDPSERGRDPDIGYIEHAYVDALRERFNSIERAAQRLKESAVVSKYGSSGSITEADPEIKKSIDTATATSTDLISAIYETYRRISDEARDHYQTSLWAVSLVSVGGVLLLFTLLRLFYRWLFVPIQALEVGAGRLALGNFDQSIEVNSGDELEDLARAFNDMTTRLRDMYGDLARQVNERSRQLVRSERLVSVGFLAAGVSHEINNPLASIAFCSEALEQRLACVLNGSATAFKGDDREVVAKYLKMIQQEAFRCKSITQRLLEFSRGGERSREPTELGEIVQSVLDVVEHLENRRGKDIHFNPDVHVIAWVNAQEIKSVVLNLVVNALDSMDEGGTLRINLGLRDGQAALEFADTGCGMSPEVLENIFEPFYTRSRTGKGTGLGLSISHRIISSHGGEIEAVSAGPGQGSKFTVRLPLKPAESVKEESLGNIAA